MKKLLFFVTKEVAHVSVRKAAAVGSRRAATVCSICIAKLLGGLKTTRQIHSTRGSLLRRCYCVIWSTLKRRRGSCLAFRFNRKQRTKNLSRIAMSWEVVKRLCRELHGEMCDEQVWETRAMRNFSFFVKLENLIFFPSTVASSIFHKVANCKRPFP